MKSSLLVLTVLVAACLQVFSAANPVLFKDLTRHVRRQILRAEPALAAHIQAFKAFVRDQWYVTRYVLANERGDISTTSTITNLQPKVIEPARMTLKEDVLAIKSSIRVATGGDGMDDTINSPKLPGVTAYGLSEGQDQAIQTITDSNVSVSATEVGVAVEMTKKMLRTVGRNDFLRRAGLTMGSAVNVKQEQDYATIIDGFGNVVGADGSAATLGNLGAGLAQLRANSEPVNEVMMKAGVSAVVHPYGWHDISQSLAPTGEGGTTAKAVPSEVAANQALSNFAPIATYYDTPIKLSTNLVVSGTDVRSGVLHRDSGLIYEFMPVELGIDEKMRSIVLEMVIDYGYGEINDGFGREWDHDITDPTS